MATYTCIAAGGNWSNNATWGGSGHPIAGDTALLNGLTGTLTLDVSSACAVLDMTGSAGTLAFSNRTLTLTGAATLLGAMTNTSGTLLAPGGVTLLGTPTGSFPILQFSGTQTFTSNGYTWPGILSFISSPTVTLADDLTVGTLLCGGSLTFSGAHNVTCTTMNPAPAARTIILVSGQNLTVTTNLQLTGDLSGALSVLLKASLTGSTKANLIYQGTAANCKVAGHSFTDIDASSGNPIVNYGAGTLTRVVNITNKTQADFGGGGGGRMWTRGYF